jgi:MYXO-CTERM domain-containing protein
MSAGNFSTGDPMLVDRAAFDYHLRPGSPCVNAGVEPGVAGAMSLIPELEYVHPAAREARVANGTIDIGAYELGGGAPLSDGGAGSGGSAGAAGTTGAAGATGVAGAPGQASSGGCSCRAVTAGGARPPGVVLLVIMALAARRRARARAGAKESFPRRPDRDTIVRSL